MVMTLEMPQADAAQTLELPDEQSAEAAADLLDAVDDADSDVPFDVAESTEGTDQPAVAEPAAEAEPTNGKPKGKRGRKKKAEQEAAAESPAATESPAEQPPAAEPAARRNPQGDDLLAEIATAEERCDAAESVMLGLKEELKAAKKDYESAVHKLRKLCRAVTADASRPLLKPSASVADSEPAAATDQPTANPDAWRYVSITELGLSAKLVEKLEEAGATTIGGLEDLRAKISQGGEKWPKGIGAARITEIENAVVDWLTKNRDSAVFGQNVVGMPPAAEAATTATVAWEDMTEEQQRDFICARSVALDDAGDLEPKHTGSRAFYEAGGIEFRKGSPVSDCSWVPGIEQDDWIRGWLAAGKAEEPATPPEPPALTTDQAESLDDLLAD